MMKLKKKKQIELKSSQFSKPMTRVMRPSSLIEGKPIKIMKKNSQLSKKKTNRNKKNKDLIWYKNKKIIIIIII